MNVAGGSLGKIQPVRGRTFRDECRSISVVVSTRQGAACSWRVRRGNGFERVPYRIPSMAGGRLDRPAAPPSTPAPDGWSAIPPEGKSLRLRKWSRFDEPQLFRYLPVSACSKRVGYSRVRLLVTKPRSWRRSSCIQLTKAISEIPNTSSGMPLIDSTGRPRDLAHCPNSFVEKGMRLPESYRCRNGDHGRRATPRSNSSTHEGAWPAARPIRMPQPSSGPSSPPRW